MEPTKRAAPMAPEDRRQSIVDAALPLIAEFGHSVTTRQIAEAAGVAEGTIFRVFEDKRELLLAAVEEAMDPAPIEEALGRIHPAATFEEQLWETGVILKLRMEEVIAVMTVLRTLPGKDGEFAPQPAFVEASNAAVNRALAALFARHASKLRATPERAAVLFRGLIFSASLPTVPVDQRPSIEEVIDLVRHGLVASEAEGH